MHPLRFLSTYAIAYAAALAVPSLSRADSAPLVHVHVSSSVAVQLEHRATVDASWREACAAPCDRDLPRQGDYRFVYVAGGETQGAIFQLRPTGASVAIEFKPTSRAAKTWGEAILVVGGGIAGLSVFGLVFGAVLAASPDDCSEGANMYCGFGQGIGVTIAAVAGVGLLVGGGVFLGGLGIRASAGPSATQRVAPSAFVREPTWTAPRVATTTKPAFLVPLTLSF